MVRLILFYLIVLLVFSCCRSRIEYYPVTSDKKVKYYYHVNVLNGRKCGEFIYFSENGDTLQNSNFNNDKLHGISKFYFNRNKLQLFVECLDNQRHGITREFYKNGQLRIEYIYNFDRLWEIKALYDSTGKKLDFGHLKEGNGFINGYYPDGTLEFHGNIKNGYRDGQWNFYTNNGVLMYPIIYKDGYGPESHTIENHYFLFVF